MFRVLIFGDIVARPGRKAIAALLPALKKEYTPNVTIANAENLAHGIGITERTISEMQNAGVDLFTSGNHIWAKSEGVALLTRENALVLRPHNYPRENPGTGVRVLTINSTRILVANLQGRVFMGNSVVDCPFRTADAILKEYATVPIKIFDFHAEATSEKVALGQYVDSRASLLFGTHTHIPTADEQILPQGTGYITDVGMTGLKRSVIGANPDAVREMFLSQVPKRDLHDTEESGTVIVNALLADIDPTSGKTHTLERIHKEIDV